VLRAGVQHSDIAGHPVDEATRKLEAAKINVKVEPYNPDAGLDNLVEFGRAPIRLEEGANVTLFTKGDKVLYYTRERESTQIRTLRKDMAKSASADASQLRADMSALRQEMLELEKKHQTELKDRDAELSDLKKQVAKLARERGGSQRGRK
jgi:hypothetical protein